MNCCIYRFYLSRNNCYRKSHFIAKHIYIYLLSIMTFLQCIVSTTNDVGLDNCGRNNGDIKMMQIWNVRRTLITGRRCSKWSSDPQQYYLSSLFSYISQYSLAFMFACCFQLSLPPNHFCPLIIY